MQNAMIKANRNTNKDADCTARSVRPIVSLVNSDEVRWSAGRRPSIHLSEKSQLVVDINRDTRYSFWEVMDQCRD